MLQVVLMPNSWVECCICYLHTLESTQHQHWLLCQMLDEPQFPGSVHFLETTQVEKHTGYAVTGSYGVPEIQLPSIILKSYCTNLPSQGIEKTYCNRSSKIHCLHLMSVLCPPGTPGLLGLFFICSNFRAGGPGLCPTPNSQNIYDCPGPVGDNITQAH